MNTRVRRVARQQMRAVRVMRLGIRTYRISCMDGASRCRHEVLGKRSRTRTNRIGRALRMPKASADHFNTLGSHPFTVFVVFVVERFRHR